MSHLYLPWGTGERCTNRPQIRNQFASTLELHKQSSYEYQEPIQRQRSPSLPPIHHIELEKKEETRRTRDALSINRNIPSAKRFAFYDEDCEGDTSGYGSETINHMNTRKQNQSLNEVTNTLIPVIAWQQEPKDKRNRPSSRTNESTWSTRSPGSGEEGRPRWGDRGVATGRLWEPTVPDARLPQMQNQKKGTPSWVERGLNMIDNTAEVLVIDQRSSSTGFDCDRSSYNGSDEGKTYLRGQNVPLEPEIKAQRENKRMKALEIQSAILSQLEDQEKRKQEERERKLKEERLEELRIQRQQEEDRLRLEEEKRRNEEKQLIEQRKLETLKKALEEAERKAKQEKEKRFVCQKQNRNFTNVVQKPVENTTSEPTQRSNIVSPTKTNRTYDINSAKSIKQDCTSQQTTEFNSPRSMSTGNLNLFIHSVPPLALENNSYNIVPIGINGNGDLVQGQSNCVQLAVLVPQNMGNNVYNVSLNPAENNESPNSGKILTPRKYRTLRTKDAFTQTDCSQTMTERIPEDHQRNIDKDYPNIDENAPQDRPHILKKDRRFGSEERFKKDIENRPKWGVNRPVAQYKKQSEKDPFYSQKRKIRQKYRPQARQYLSHSSDDSRSPSPFPRTDKQIEHHSKPRNSLSQSYWKSKRSSQDLTDIIIGQLSTHETSDIKKSPKMSPSKRMTLSQKFINDKYGNRKLWVDETVEKTSKPTMDLEQEQNKDKMSKIDDLFDKKRDEAPMLDLSKTVINTAEEYRAVLDKVPDFKTRPEKVRADDIKIKDKPEDQKTKTPRKEIKAYEKLGTRGYEEKNFTFMDPIPVEMRGLKFEELLAVPIEWRMLTSIRPKSKLDEEYFNRLIELGKSEMRTQARDKREFAKNTMVRKTKNRSGVTETRIVSCSECGEEYCDGKMCMITNYDMFARLKVEVESKSTRVQVAPAQTGKLRRLRRRVRRKTRSKSAAPPPRKTNHKAGAKSDSEL